MTTPQLDDVKQRLRIQAEVSGSSSAFLADRATVLQLLDAIDEKDRMLDEARAALAGLMEAHRVVFKSSLFPAFQAGKTNFNGAWVKADAALTKLEEMKR